MKVKGALTTIVKCRQATEVLARRRFAASYGIVLAQNDNLNFSQNRLDFGLWGEPLGEAVRDQFFLGRTFHLDASRGFRRSEDQW
jgi:hypothetical protein